MIILQTKAAEVEYFVIILHLVSMGVPSQAIKQMTLVEGYILGQSQVLNFIIAHFLITLLSLGEAVILEMNRHL